MKDVMKPKSCMFCLKTSEIACLIPQAAAYADVSPISNIDMEVTRRLTCRLLDLEACNYYYSLLIDTYIFFGLKSNAQLGRYLARAVKNPTLTFHPTR